MQTTISDSANARQRGRPRGRLALPTLDQRPKLASLLVVGDSGKPAPEGHAALVRFLAQIAVAETAPRAADKLDALEGAFAALRAAELSASDLWRAAR